jgi:lipopolysaccharide assembly outer membrane protein LptD (OstA)
MKKMIFGSLAFGFIAVAIALSQENPKHAQIATPQGSNVQFVADKIERQAQVMKLKGNVEIRTHDMSLHADDVTYDQKTGEIEATGKVRIKLETQN